MKTHMDVKVLNIPGILNPDYEIIEDLVHLSDQKLVQSKVL